MSNFLFAFIISGAVAHVSWNVFLKKTEHKIAFTRGFTLMASVLLLPTLFFMGPINPKAIPYFIGSIIIHVFYKIYLCRVYDHSNLSYGYPIARGLPSLLILFLTPMVFGTELTIKNEIAIIVLLSGIFLLIFADGRINKINFAGLKYALLVSMMITIYTIVDSLGVRASDPFKYIAYYFIIDGFAFNFASHFFLKDKAFNFVYLKKNFFILTICGALSIYSYVTAVYGFSVHNVASVAALREVSILFASIYGFFFLKEKIGLLGIIAGFLIFSGTVLIKLFS